MNKKFVYFLTNVASREWLKNELAIFRPKLKFSYSRGGFITFVNAESNGRPEDFTYLPVFARHHGYSQTKGTREECVEFYEKTKSKFPLLDTTSAKVTPPAPYYELIEVSEDEFFLGFVDHNESRFPLNDPKVELAENAPSRAYFKILEVDRIGDLKIGAQDTVVEFGSSPGGAVFALLEKGANVFGVDTGEMDDICLKHPKFTWIKKSIQETLREDFKGMNIDWVISDMNLSPFAVFSELKSFYERTLISPKKGFILTLKMTKQEMIKELDSFEDKLFKRGYQTILMKQLPSHHQEFAIVAIKR